MSAIASRKLEASASEAVDPGDAAAGAGLSGGRTRRSGLRRTLKRARRKIAARTSSSLTRRIVVLNLAGLLALLLGFLALNTFRQSLIDTRVQSLFVQGEIIAGAIAASATVEPGGVITDPDRLLQMGGGDGANAADEPSPLEFSINPERVAPLLRRLVTPTGTRARVFDRDGTLTLDSRNLYSRGDISRPDGPPLKAPEPTLVEKAWRTVSGWFGRTRPPFEEIGPAEGGALPEVARALAGAAAFTVRANRLGETIVSVAVPIQRQRPVRGALLLSTPGGDIDAMVASERFALLQVFLVAAAIMVLLSLLLAGAIVGPVRRLAEAAERVRHGIKTREEIPDFTARSDEIGHLSGALRDMTGALYDRMEAIESFAADVAHELKNPLTSLRSAVETLPLARTDASRERLLSIIQHDVRRLDRLISDISDASRLDAELARADAEPVDLRQLVETVVSVANERRRPDDPAIRLATESGSKPKVVTLGHDRRLAQVVNNLIDNARSFSPPGGTVRVSLERDEDEAVITVDDDGPGIPPHALERIFDRFYTDRPEQGFGQNSGLGLSISRQIVDAHRGTIRAVNRAVEGEPPRGARFVVRLPLTDE